jgi:Protein of unknown function (DUF2970)
MTIGRTFKAVAWSFFGVRKGSDHERDVAELKPQQVIVVGIVCAALFVALLVVIVNWVIGSGVAAG